MKNERSDPDPSGLSLLALVVGGVLAIGVVIVLFRLDQDQVFTLALILVGSLSLAAVLAGVALVLRARRPPTPPVERHVIKERILDGRQPGRPQVIALPQPPSLPSGLYPHLLRGAYQAGQNTGRDGSEWDRYEDWEGTIIDADDLATQNS